MNEPNRQISDDAAIFTFGDAEHRRRAYIWVEEGILTICYEWDGVIFESRGPEPDGKLRRLEIKLLNR